MGKYDLGKDSSAKIFLKNVNFWIALEK